MAKDTPGSERLHTEKAPPGPQPKDAIDASDVKINPTDADVQDVAANVDLPTGARSHPPE